MTKNNWTSTRQYLYIPDRFQVRGDTIIGKLVKNEYCPRNGEEAYASKSGDRPEIV